MGIMELKVIVTIRFEMEMEMETGRVREKGKRAIMCLPCRRGRRSQE